MDTPDRRHVARIVASARRARGLQQTDVAQATGLPVSSVSRLETGHIKGPRLTLELVGRLAETLGLYPEAFFPGDPPFHAMRMLRGRMNTHFLCLGRWVDLPEIVEHCLDEIHHFRPDIVGMSLLIPGDGEDGYKPNVAYGAALGGLRIAPQRVASNSERVRRSTDFGGVVQRHPEKFNVLTPAQARIPGCDLAQSILEVPSGAGTFWFALSHADPPEADPELHPGARTSVPWHVGDVFTRGLANLRGIDDADHADPTIAALLDRMERLELALQKSGRR